MDLDLLQSFALFAALEPELLATVARHLSARRVAVDQVVTQQGETANALLLVAEGQLETSWRDTEDGLEYSGPVLGPGEDLGLAEALTGLPCLSTARAREATTLWQLGAEDLARLSRSSAPLTSLLTRELAERLHGERSRHVSRTVDLSRVRADSDLWTLLPREDLLRRRALPLALHGGVLVTGLVEPGDAVALDELARALPRYRIRPVPLDALEFERFFRVCVAPSLDRRKAAAGQDDERWFRSLGSARADLRFIEPAGESGGPDERSRQVSGEQIIELMNRLLSEALQLGASDIHIEPSETELVVRYRVDGRLKKRPESLDTRFHRPLISRFKVLGHMDIAEKRRAQDGRLALSVGGREVDFRLSTVPTRFGEKIVLRILDPSSILIDMERLIPREATRQAVRWMVEQPQGMVIVAGPTGSGKTTTIYSALLRLREDEINICTIEDPIEYTIQGITQVQVNDAAGVSFANSVRHFLRQDPDVILVGETRDPQTAETSIEAALTGHLVLTTLHANDAVGTVYRLREMGVEPFLLANTVLGVVSQRLVRRVCAHCRQPVVYPPQLVRPLGLFCDRPTDRPFTFFRGAGCVHCNYQGFRGRTGVFEVLQMGERLRPLVAGGVDRSELERAARGTGLLQPMAAYCEHLLVSGITTPEEIARVLLVER